MKEFHVEVHVAPREGILDPQGEAVESAVHSLGFSGVEDVRVGRLLRFRLRAESLDDARGKAEQMCRDLLANPVTEDFDLDITEGAGVPA